MRSIAAQLRELAREDPSLEAPAMDHAVRALVSATHGRALAPDERSGPALAAFSHWLASELSDRSLSAELLALSARLGGAHPGPFVLEHLAHALDPRARVQANLYATPAPVAGWLARAAIDAARARWPDADLARFDALDPACGGGALLCALAHAEPLLRDRLYGIELDPRARSAAQVHLACALDAPQAASRIALGDALAGPSRVGADRSDGIIIVANPPFSDGRPMSEHLHTLVHGRDPVSPASYRAIEGERALRNSKWLDSGHLRFLRWIHGELDRAPRGVAVVALGHGLLDHPTFAPVRRALATSFDEVRALDLHGAARHGLLTPDGRRDQNVFEIQQGVALLVLVRDRGPREGAARVLRADLWGTREEKFSALDEGALRWSAARPVAPSWRFDAVQDRAIDKVSDDEDARAWSAMVPITEALLAHAPAIITGHDAFTLSFSRDEAEAKLRDLADETLSDERLRERWGGAIASVNLAAAREAARQGAVTVRKWSYRPWDHRFALDHRALVDRARAGPVMDALRTGETLAIVTRRQSPPERPWRYALATRDPVCDGVLRADPHGTELVLSREALVRGALAPNVRPAWLAELGERLSREADEALFREAFCWIFATLCDPSYRARHGAALAREVPRVPWPSDQRAFAEGVARGARWITTHADPIEPATEPPRWSFEADATIERVQCEPQRERITLGVRCWIDGVRADEMTHEIGARRPAVRWLEDRVGRVVRPEDIEAYAALLARVRACAALERAPTY